MKNTVNISITLDADLLAYIDELSLINSRSRSGMIAWIISKEKLLMRHWMRRLRVMSKEKTFVDGHFIERLLELGNKCAMAGGDTVELQLPEIDGLKLKVEISFYWEDIEHG